MKNKTMLINTILFLSFVLVAASLYYGGIVYDEYATPNNWDLSYSLWFSLLLIIILYSINQWLLRKTENVLFQKGMVVALIIGLVFILGSVVNNYIVLNQLIYRDPKAISITIEEGMQYKKVR